MSKILINTYHLNQNTERQKRPRRRARKMSPEEITLLRFLATLIDYDCATEPGWHRLRRIRHSQIAEGLGIPKHLSVNKIKRAVRRGFARRVDAGCQLGTLLEINSALLNPASVKPGSNMGLKTERENKTKASGYIYYILDPDKGAVKIGYSKNVDRRFKQHQTSNSSELELLGFHTGTPEHEGRLHEKFTQLRVRERSEWFKATAELRRYIKTRIKLSKYDGSENFQKATSLAMVLDSTELCRLATALEDLKTDERDVVKNQQQEVL